MRATVSKFRIAALLLLTVSIIYAVALYIDMQNYETWKQAYLQSHPDLALWIDFAPYATTNLLAVFIAPVLMLFWSFLIIWKMRTYSRES